MRNKMQKTFAEMEKAIVAEIKLEHPDYRYDLVQAVFLGKLLAYASEETLKKILDGYVQECSRCGQDALASEHGTIGCDA